MTRDESVEKENERKWGNVHLGENSFLRGEEYSELPLGGVAASVRHPTYQKN